MNKRRQQLLAKPRRSEVGHLNTVETSQERGDSEHHNDQSQTTLEMQRQIYFEQRRAEEVKAEVLRENSKKAKMALKEQSMQTRPVCQSRWLTAAADDSNEGLSQSEIDKRAQTFNLVLRDILAQLY